MRCISVLVAAAAISAADWALAYRVRLTMPSSGGVWQKSKDKQVDPSQKLKLVIHLAQKDEDAIVNTLLNVSTPGSLGYGKYPHAERIKEIAAADPKAKEAVLNWLKPPWDTYIARTAYDSIHLSLTVAKANELLRTEYEIWGDREGNTALVAPQYFLPDELRHAIVDITPTTILPGLRGKPLWGGIDNGASEEEFEKKRAFGGNGPYSPYTPPICGINNNQTCTTPYNVAQLYNFTNYEAKNNTILGIFSGFPEFAEYADLEQFIATYAPGKIGPYSNFTTVGLQGAYNWQGQIPLAASILEGQLDAQVAVSLGSPVHTTFIIVQGTAATDTPSGFMVAEPFYDFFSYLMDLPDDQLPRVVTLSYSFVETWLNVAYSRRLCNLIAQVSARGVSVLVATGDHGAGETCIFDNYQEMDPGVGPIDGLFQELNNTARFNPFFPASCPWLTAVGSTQSVSHPESAGSWSGGGFSDVFPQPAYQNCSVSNFLNGHPEAWMDWKTKNYFNVSGRAIPDVSAAGNNFVIISNGTAIPLYGTSVSTPLFAAIIALLNSERASNGKPPLGFLNPWLYSQKVQDAQGLTDVTQGTSVGCTGSSTAAGNQTAIPAGTPFTIIPGAGWKAVKGWDPSTGLGTPWFPGLLAALP